MYPGLIGWTIINLGLAHKQWTTMGRVTNSVILVNLFQVSPLTFVGYPHTHAHRQRAKKRRKNRKHAHRQRTRTHAASAHMPLGR